jgi:uncharacterized protein with von Willebrand factor type A (vWA) domain
VGGPVRAQNVELPSQELAEVADLTRRLTALQDADQERAERLLALAAQVRELRVRLRRQRARRLALESLLGDAAPAAPSR